MFEWLKKLFKKEDKTTEACLNQIGELRLELEKARAQLDWFESLGLPTAEVLDGGFDYYDHMKSVIEELREDKKALIARNSNLHHRVKQLEALERAYLQEIRKLKKDIEMLKLAKAPMHINLSIKQTEGRPKSEQEPKEEETSTKQTKPAKTLKEASKTLKGLKKFNKKV